MLERRRLRKGEERSSTLADGCAGSDGTTKCRHHSCGSVRLRMPVDRNDDSETTTDNGDGVEDGVADGRLGSVSLVTVEMEMEMEMEMEKDGKKKKETNERKGKRESGPERRPQRQHQSMRTVYVIIITIYCCIAIIAAINASSQLAESGPPLFAPVCNSFRVGSRPEQERWRKGKHHRGTTK